jgi:preprotein translocase subunit SecG
LFKLTGGLAIAFFVTSLSLSSMVAHQYRKTELQVIPQQNSGTEGKIPLPVDSKK